jgi:hypothetical protein
MSSIAQRTRLPGRWSAAGLRVSRDQPGNNQVVNQAPSPGMRVLCGWVVTLIIERPPQPVTIPPLPSPVEIPTVEPLAPLVLPAPPAELPPPAPVARVAPVPWFWPFVIALLLLSGALLVGLLVLLALRSSKGPGWVCAHVRAVAGAASGADVEVMEPRTDQSPRSCAVRLEPHADRGVQVLEEVSR